MSLGPRLLVPALVMGMAMPASAGEFAALRQEIAAARQALVTMITRREMRGPNQQMLVKVSADAVSAHFARLKAPAGRVVQFNELRSTWEAFKATREQELVPAILVNDRLIYEKIGAGIQKERLDRMYALIEILER